MYLQCCLTVGDLEDPVKSRSRAQDSLMEVFIRKPEVSWPKVMVKTGAPLKKEREISTFFLPFIVGATHNPSRSLLVS